jgi:hypothetical protein
MEDADFDDLLDDYEAGEPTPNFDMLDVEMVWIRGNPGYGSDHIAINNVTEEEVEEVLLQVPPKVEAKRHKDYPGRTRFWGATRAGRWLFIVYEDWKKRGKRFLKPITAFEPEEGESYWRQQ